MSVDAIVIGAGLNGLVAAALLAREGWSTTVLERNPDVGGAVRSGELTEPGLIHDRYATNLNLFAASPAYAELAEDLGRHGFELATTGKAYANAFPDGSALRVVQDAGATLAGIRAHDPRDADGWDALHARFTRFRDTLLPLYFQGLPSSDMAMGLVKAVRELGVAEASEIAQLLLRSTRELGDTWFATPEAKALIATWGLHLDFGPDVSGGAMFPFIEAFSDMENGIAVARGGASRLPEALAALITEQGGEVRTDAPVRRVLVEGGRATGVELASGERIHASRAVVANLTPTVLFDGLVDPADVPDDVPSTVSQYRYGPATMMVHLALSAPIPWRAPGLEDFAYVHLAPYVDDLSRTYTQSQDGLLPDSPLLIVGQTTAVDPSRAPEGRHIAWIQVRTLPSEIRGDGGDGIDARDWDAAAAPFAERVIDKLEVYAPGLRDLIVSRAVESPADLERHNPNLVGGDSVAGSHHLSQNLIFRPFPGWSGYSTPVEDLHMVGAATWPGAGTNAASGQLLASSLLADRSRSRTAMGVAGAAGAALVAAGAAAGIRRMRA